MGGEIDRLISKQGTGDPDVLEAMVREFNAPIYRLALSILNDTEDAQDVTQDTFIQAAAHLDRYQVGTNFKAWLFTIAVNNCRMILRKRTARRALYQVWLALTQGSTAQPGPETQIAQAESREALWRLVDTLDDKHRLVVVLRLVHGLTVSEISQVLGVKEKTVYNRLYDAFAHLRGLIRLKPELAHLQDEVQS